MTSIQDGCLWDITKIEISLFDPSYYLICNQNKLKFTVQLHDHELFNIQMNLWSFSVKFFIQLIYCDYVLNNLLGNYLSNKTKLDKNLLWNYCSNWNQTLQEWCLEGGDILSSAKINHFIMVWQDTGLSQAIHVSDLPIHN